jgi:alpha-tubulin suppressor-like RCC1 family protein
MSRPPGLSSISGIEEDDEIFIPWESLDICVRGSPLLKFGRQGEPHFRDFQLSQDCKFLAWASQKKTDGDSRVILRGCKLFEGQQTDVFRRQNRGDLEGLCFSLMYDDPQRRGQLRSLDVACKDRREYDAWVTALSFLCTSSPPQGLLRARQSSLWVDVTPIGSSNGKGGIGAKSNSRITKDLKKRIKDTNDIYSWGRSSWGELGLGDEATHPRPTLVNMLLGKAVKYVACGSSHCIAVCEEGETYAWGHGGCGRLGTGSVDHELSPRLLLRPTVSDRGSSSSSSSKSFQRNENTPFRFRTVACGDMHSLGVGLEDGHVYTWGAGSSGALGSTRRTNQLYPTLIPGCVSIIQLAEGSPSESNSNQVIQSRASMASTANVLPPRLVLVKPHVVAVGAGNSYSSFVDNQGRIFTCGNMESPLGHDVANLSRIMQSIKNSFSAVATVAAASMTASSSSSSASLGGGGGGGISQISPARLPVISMTSTGTNSSIGSESSHATGSSHGKKTGLSLAAMAAAVAAAAEANTISIAASAAGLELIPKSILMRETKASPRPHDPSQEPTLQSEIIADNLALVVEGCLESFAGGGATTAASDLLVPVQVLVGGLSGSGAAVQTLALSCGDMHMCVVTSGGHAYSWGWGGSGALGHGDTLDRTIPSRISSLPRDVVEVACGAAHTLVLVDRLLPLPPPPSMPPPTAISAPERENSGSFSNSSASAVPSTPTSVGMSGSTHNVPSELQIHRDSVRELYAFGSSAYGQVPAPRGVSTESVSTAASNTSRAGARPGTICVLPRLVDMPLVSKNKDQSSKKGLQSVGKDDEDATSLRAIPRSIAAGAFHSAFISTENVLYVCGTGSRGELGISASAAASLAQSVVPNSSASSLSPSGSNGKKLTSSAVSPAGDLLRASSGFSGIALRIKSLKIVPWEITRPHLEGSSESLSSSSADSLTSSQNTVTARRSSFAGGDDLAGKGGALLSPRSIGSPVGFSIDNDTSAPTAPHSSNEESKVDVNKVGFGDLRPKSLVLGHIYSSLGIQNTSKETINGQQHIHLSDNGFDSDENDDEVESKFPDMTQQEGSTKQTRNFPNHSLSKADARRLQQEKELDIRRSASPTIVPEYKNEAYMRTTSSTGSNQIASEALSPISGSASAAHSGVVSLQSSTAAEAVAAAAKTARSVFSRSRTQTSSNSSGSNMTSVATKFSPFSDSSFLTSTALSMTSSVSRRSDAILDSTLSYGFLPVPGLMTKEVRSVSCGNGFTVASVATEWMNNDAALICMRCSRPFTTFFRKHHCRLCGGVFCTECSSSKTPLLKLGYIEPVRVCDGCFARV